MYTLMFSLLLYVHISVYRSNLLSYSLSFLISSGKQGHMCGLGTSSRQIAARGNLVGVERESFSL